MIAIDRGHDAGIGAVAEAFIAALPEIEVVMDGLVLRGGWHRRVPLDASPGRVSRPIRAFETQTSRRGPSPRTA
jgi:hypothetical protein